MPGVKTNEVAGTRAVLRHYRMSAYKARQVLDLVRGKDADRAEEILAATPREAARVIEKVLASAVANARNNDQLDPDELFVSACFADEGTTLKRWRPRARGRATRIRKRTCHITVIVSRLPEDRLERRRSRQAALTTGLRSRRVAASRRGAAAEADAPTAEAPAEETDFEELDGAEDQGETVDGEGTDVETDLVDDADADADVEAGESVSEDAAVEAEPEVEAAAEVEPEVEPEVEVAAEVEAAPEAEGEDAPAPKARRARSPRKKTTKAADDADGGDAGAAGEEEKG
jgi:large subunit ribosomal protein L22